MGFWLHSEAGTFRLKPVARAVLFAALVAISLIATIARVYAIPRAHPIEDERIARAVVVEVLKSGSLDTNWARTSIDKTFRYDEYNFSPYYLAAALYIDLDGRTWEAIHRDPLPIIRMFSAILGGLSVFFAGLLGLRMGGVIPALTAASLTACAPSLFQDGFYARPETFVTLLSLLFMITLTSDYRRGGMALAIAGLLVGVLVATKITFLIYIPFPLLLASRLLSPTERSDGGPDHAYWTLCISGYFCMIGAGFLLGAPYAVKYPWEYLNGLASLFKQYEVSVLGTQDTQDDISLRVMNNSAYLAYTLGYAVLLLATCGIADLIKRRNLQYALIFAPPVLVLLYFMRAKPCFERNFSQSLPVMFVLTGIGIAAIIERVHLTQRLSAIISAMLIIACVATPALVTASIIDPSLDGRFQAEIDAQAKNISQGGHVMILNAQPAFNQLFCGPYAIKAPRDSENYIQSMLRQGYRIAAAVDSPFINGPVSTLEPYYSPSTVFLTPPPTTDACAIGLVPLVKQTDLRPVKTLVTMTGGWKLGGANAATPSGGWDWPLYGSWSGSYANTGKLEIGPFHACGSVLIPYTIGRGDLQMSLTITRHSRKIDTVIYSGIPPGIGYQWQAMRIYQDPHTCADYSIAADDHGVGWEEWMGIGLPVEITVASPHR